MAYETPDGASRPFFLAPAVFLIFCSVILTACGDSPAVTPAAKQALPSRPAVDMAAMVPPEADSLRGRRAESPAVPACPFPQHVAHHPDTILPGRSRSQLDADVVAAYESWKRDYLLEVDAGAAWPPLYRVSFGSDAPERSVSEGIGYGMLLTVLMAGQDPDARTYFDGLWRFARLHPSSIDTRFMAWQVPARAGGDAAAFDGDADMALALLMADRQWGSGGEIDYRREASLRIEALFESMIGPDSRLPMLGDWVDPYGAHRNQHTPRSSDFMPASFRAFGSVDGRWLDVYQAVLDLVGQMQATHAPRTGLLPDFIEPDDGGGYRPASAGFLEGPHDGDYHYNAGRLPLRLGMDGLLQGGQALTSLRRIAAFAAARVEGGVERMGAGFTLDGKPYGDYFTTFFAAPFAVALMSDPQYQAALDALYEAIRARRENYYEDSIKLLSLMLLSGNFWTPDHACGR